MTSYTSILVATAAVVSLCGCAAAANQTTARGDRVVGTTNDAAIRTHEGPTSSETTVNAPPPAMLAALSSAYGDLGIEVKLWNPQTGEVGNKNFSRPSTPAADQQRRRGHLTGEQGNGTQSHIPPFQPGESIGSKYTCEDRDVSPPLEWSGAPPWTKTYALIVDDPDAPDAVKPQRVYVHWVIYNLPGECHGCGERGIKLCCSA